MHPRLILSVLAAILLVGCGRAPEPQQHKLRQVPLKPMPLPRDDLGREIKLSATPRRIVTIGPGVTETVFALGLEDHLVGRDSGSDYPPDKVQRIPVVGNFTGPFLEKTAAVRPDFIIVQGETYDRTRADLWQQKCGAPVAVLNAQTLREVSQGIEKIGAWLGARDKSLRLAKHLAPPQIHASGTNGVRAFFEVQRAPLWTAGQGTLINDMLEYADFINIVRIKGYKPYGLESLIKQNPDVYVVAEKQPNRARTLRELRAQPGLRALKCVREGRVIVLPADWALRPGPRLRDANALLRRERNALKLPG